MHVLRCPNVNVFVVFRKLIVSVDSLTTLAVAAVKTGHAVIHQYDDFGLALMIELNRNLSKKS